jgi:Mn2+/Fe2+ NRAMP family transporter
MEAEDVKHAKQLLLAGRKLVSNSETSAQPTQREKNVFRLLIQKMQLDVNIGMLLSNIVMFFIILATGTALYSNGTREINTVEEAAKALEPIAGRASYLLFALGVIGTGFLAIPVLSGALSYIVSETFGWKGSLDKPFGKAKEFYIVIIVSLVVGLLINYIGISPIQALVYTAILYGLTSPVIIAIILHIGNNKKIMGKYTNRGLSNALGVVTLVLMSASAIALLFFMMKG